MAYAAGAAAAAMAQAVKASGAIVSMESDSFLSIVNHADRPLVIVAQGGMLDRGFRYLVSHKGFVFYTKSRTELMLPGKAEVVRARSIWVPS